MSAIHEYISLCKIINNHKSYFLIELGRPRLIRHPNHGSWFGPLREESSHRSICGLFQGNPILSVGHILLQTFFCWTHRDLTQCLPIVFAYETKSSGFIIPHIPLSIGRDVSKIRSSVCSWSSHMRRGNIPPQSLGDDRHTYLSMSLLLNTVWAWSILWSHTL